MSKRKRINPKTSWAIRTYVKQGLSANKIQKILQKKDIGIRRKVLLAEIRKVKHQKPKAHRYKFTPKKFRRRTSGIPHPPRERRQVFTGRQVAVYGYARTSRHPRAYSARFEFYGSGKDLFKAVKLAHDGIVPRKEWAFVRCHARDFLNNPYMYGERGIWTERPEVRS